MNILTPLSKVKPRHLATFDLETTGVNIESARIVTAFVGVMDTETGEHVERYEWILDPGIEIPTGASDVHGITTERARAEGTDAKQGVYDIAFRLDVLQRRGLPFVVMNGAYDISLLDREIRRHWWGMRSFEPVVMLDPLVIDRYLFKYRKGAGERKLVRLAHHYGVPVREDAHDAEADCWMSGRIVVKQLEDESLQHLSLKELHNQEIGWHRKWAVEFEAYLQKTKPGEKVNADWPMVPYFDPCWDPNEKPTEENK